jgi:D-glycero-D-manno-heptose 1,7-bisphosphate phosphatase
MIFKAVNQLNLSLSDSVMIGDKLSDMEAGNAAGVGRLYMIKPKNKDVQESKLAEVKHFDNLLSCAKYIYAHDKI